MRTSLRSEISSINILFGLVWIQRSPVLFKKRVTDERIFAQCYTRCGWYRLANNDIVSSILHPVVLGCQVNHRYGLIDLLALYEGRAEIYNSQPSRK